VDFDTCVTQRYKNTQKIYVKYGASQRERERGRKEKNYL